MTEKTKEILERLDPSLIVKVEKHWVYKGLDCVVRTVNFGHRCGYVRIPEGHPIHGKDLTKSDCDMYLDVHGGITFSEKEDILLDKSKGFWVGFDCAHCFDRRDESIMSEYYKQHLSILNSVFSDNGIELIEWTLSRVQEEVENMADQVLEIK